MKKTEKTILFIAYFSLVIINITLSAILVDTISNFIPIYATFIKVVVDLLIFVINFFIQKKFIFNQTNDNNFFKIYITINFFCFFIY